MTDNPIVLPQPVGQAERIHYLDNVRALAMLLGLVFHAGLTYARPAQAIWLVNDWQGSPLIDAGIWFLHIFRMATFFLIAGYFAKFLVQRRGTRKFLWNRFVRIVCPFLLFYPFLIAAYIVAIIVAYAPRPENLPPLMAMNKSGKPPVGSLTTMHLWFLYYLAMFSLLAAILANLKSTIVDRVADWFCGDFWPTLLIPLALVPALWFAGTPVAASESFVPTPWVFGYYGLLFAAGWKLWSREHYLDVVGRHLLLLVLLSSGLYALYYYLMPNLALLRNPATAPEIPLHRQAATTLLTAYLSVFLTLITLLLGKKFLSGHSHLLRYISDASYWIYLVHLPLMLLIQGLMAPTQWNLWLKFAISLLSTFAITLALYAVFVRHTPIGWMLNGKKPFPWHLFGSAKPPVAQKELIASRRG